MARRFVLVSHAGDESDDRASAWLARQGYRSEWICPADGEALPQMGEDVAGTIVYGGKFDVDQQDDYPFLKDELRWIDCALRRDVPVLGICLGAQLMAHVLGQKVHAHPAGCAEYGYYRIEATPEGKSIIGEDLTVLQSHWHGWYQTPAGATLLARSELFPQQAFRYGAHSFAVQFHPETSLVTMARWVGRRGERNFLPGAFAPGRQIADHALHDGRLGQWFEGFLARWAGLPQATRAAAE